LNVARLKSTFISPSYTTLIKLKTMESYIFNDDLGYHKTIKIELIKCFISNKTY